MAVGGCRQRKHLAQLRTGSHWLTVETGRYGNTTVERAQARTVARQKHQSLFARGRAALVLFYPGPYRIGCFGARLSHGLQRVISNSVLFFYRCLVRRPAVGYLNRPGMALNRL